MQTDKFCHLKKLFSAIWWRTRWRRFPRQACHQGWVFSCARILCPGGGKFKEGFIFCFQTKLLEFFVISDTSADILAPFAVIPLETPNAEASASIQDYAEASNSNLVYAQDEFGNNIAVGVFVTEEFHPFVKSEDLSMGNPTENQDINWVAAVEECLTECNEYSSIENAAGSPQKDSIRVYKVKKQKNGRKENKGSSRNARKTLSELKQVKAIKTKQKVSPPKMKNTHISENIPSCKKSRQIRKVYDKSYKPSCSVNTYNLGSTNDNFIAITLFN